jgi:hypothetical protein
MGSKDVVSDVHLVGLEPVAVDVEVDRTYDLLSDQDAGRRMRIVVTGSQPAP